MILLRETTLCNVWKEKGRVYIAPLKQFVKMKQALSVLAFLLCISFGYGLKCYACFSTNSWDDCTPKEMTCPFGSDRCATAHAVGKVQDVSGSVYNKGCATSNVCDEGSCKPFVPFDHSTISKCELSCCSGDLCNGAKVPTNEAKVPMVSAIMLLACALVAFFR